MLRGWYLRIDGGFNRVSRCSMVLIRVLWLAARKRTLNGLRLYQCCRLRVTQKRLQKHETLQITGLQIAYAMWLCTHVRLLYVNKRINQSINIGFSVARRPSFWLRSNLRIVEMAWIKEWRVAPWTLGEFAPLCHAHIPITIACRRLDWMQSIHAQLMSNIELKWNETPIDTFCFQRLEWRGRHQGPSRQTRTNNERNTGDTSGARCSKVIQADVVALLLRCSWRLQLFFLLNNEKENRPKRSYPSAQSLILYRHRQFARAMNMHKQNRHRDWPVACFITDVGRLKGWQ